MTDVFPGAISSIAPHDRLKVIVIGAGKMGLLHGGLLSASGMAEVVGLVDRSRMARFLPRAVGLPVQTYASLDSAITKVQPVDAVVVCTPPGSHHAVARQALEFGLHVFVEKPLTTSPEDSRALVDLQEGSDLVGIVGYVRRFHPVFRAMHAAIADSELSTLDVRILSPQFADTPSSGVNRGGLEWDLLPHACDMLFWLLKGPRNCTLERATGDMTGSIRVDGTAGDTAIALEANWACSSVRKVEMRVSAKLSDGTRFSCDEDQLWHEAPDGLRTRVFHKRDAAAPWFDIAGQEFSVQATSMIWAFQGRTTTSATLREALWTDEFIGEALTVALDEGA